VKKLIALFVLGFVVLDVNADARYAHEYASDNDDERREYRRDDGYESEHREPRSLQTPRYPQNYQQPPIQIYMSPNANSYSRDQHHPPRPYDKAFQEERFWRERRNELQQMPQTPSYENQFDRDDTHW
jgi:hypothetical protein